MPYKKICALAAIAGAALFLTGCEDATMTVHEPGVYKGPTDESATVEAAEAREKALRERAVQALSDR